MEVGKGKLSQRVSLSGDLNELERYIEDFWSFLPTPVCYVNPLFNITDIDKTLREMSGYGQIEIIGKGIEIFFGRKEDFKEIRKELETEKIIHGKEAVFVTKVNKKIPVSVSALTREDEKGNVIGYFFAFVDITEKKEFERKLEKEVQKKTTQLEDKIRELEKMNELMINRELRMVKLKKEIKQAREKISNG